MLKKQVNSNRGEKIASKVQTLVQSAYAAMQGGQVVAAAPPTVQFAGSENSTGDEDEPRDVSV